MSNRTAGAASGVGGTRWGAVAVGWLVAVVAGIGINLILSFLYGLFAEPPVEPGELTTAVVVMSLATGFLSYLMGLRSRQGSTLLGR